MPRSCEHSSFDVAYIYTNLIYNRLEENASAVMLNVIINFLANFIFQGGNVKFRLIDFL